MFGGLQQVPLWRCRTDTTNLNALDSSTLRIETESPSITHIPLSSCDRESYGNGEVDQTFSSGGATLQAEEELREARYATVVVCIYFPEPFAAGTNFLPPALGWLLPRVIVIGVYIHTYKF